MNTFESSLLAELRGFVAERDAAPGTRRRRPNPRWGWAVLPAGAIVTGAVLLASSPAASAYTVRSADDGDVVVTISKLSDAAGLEKALQAKGIEAHVDYQATLPGPPPGGGFVSGGTDAGGKHLESGSGDPAPVTGCGWLSPIHVSMAADAVTFDIPAADVHSSATLYITTAGAADSGVGGVRIRYEC